MRILNLDRLLHEADAQADSFTSAVPYPHIVINDFLSEEACDALLEEFEMPRMYVNFSLREQLVCRWVP